MKKFISLLIVLVLIISSFSACNGRSEATTEPPSDVTTEEPSENTTEKPKDNTTEAPAATETETNAPVPQRLAEPIVELVGNVAYWQADPNADRFEISLDGELKYLENTVESRKLDEGVSFKVRAIGDGVNYLTSEWSNVVVYVVATTEAVEITTEAPEITTEAEETTTEAEETTTEAEETTTEAEETTTEAEETTTEAEETTTEAEDTTTEAEETTTEAEETTTEAVEITTEAEETTTEAVEITTEAVEITTEAVEITTEAEEITTEAVEITTEAGDTPEEPEIPDDPKPENKVTVSDTILNVADKNSWSDATQYLSFKLDGNITVSATGGENTGKFYSNGNNWRIYQSEGASVTVSAKSGVTIVSVTITYDSNKSGVLTVGGRDVASGAVLTVNASSVTLTVENTGSATNGQARITAIEVVYTTSEGGSTGGDDSGEQGGQGNQPPEPPVTPPATNHTYTDFTPEEKEIWNQYIGAVIPFIPCDEYYLDGYYEGYGYEYGINFYAYDNTEAEFEAYRNSFSDYSLSETYDDDYGTWYIYTKNDVVVELAIYEISDEEYGTYTVVDVYVYSSLSLDLEEDGGDVGGDGGDVGGDGGATVPSDVDLITNNGKGLPEDDGDGIFDVDFTQGKYAKNVTDQGLYIGGCPTVGSPAVLVIPVEFTDVTNESKGYTIENLKKIFVGGEGALDYVSVDAYFYQSSYGKLDLDITIVDWFTPKNTSSYYADAETTIDGYKMDVGDQMILDEALAYLDQEKNMDLSKFDSDGNGIIDAVVMVSTLDIAEPTDETAFYWAYRYWNYYSDTEYDGVSANDFAWLPYQFMFEEYTAEGANYDTSNPLNPYTFIHEFSHVLGADDYYDTSYSDDTTSGPLDGCDIMDSMTGDHNPYTKFNYGWLTTSKLITGDNVTVTLEAFVDSGDTVIIANNWDAELGAYQEYFVIMYYTNTGLNEGDGYGYFGRDGIVVYHVDASLYAEEYNGKTYYDVYFNNTDASDSYGTAYNLIEYVKSAAGNFTYIAGDVPPENVADNAGNALGYTFTVDEIGENGATLTFKKTA